MTAQPSTVIAGDAFLATVTVVNRHGQPSAPGSVIAFLGPDRAGTKRFSSIPAGASRRVKLTLTVPALTPPGSLVLAACRAAPGPRTCAGGRVTRTLTIQSQALLTIAPTSHTFADTATGETSVTQSFTVTNTGQAPSGVISTGLSGTDAGEFAISADTCDTAALAGSDSCSLSVSSAPTTTGAKSASLDVSATPGGTASATLGGNGVAPANLEISPTSKAFGTHTTGTASSAQTFTVTNTGGVTSGSITTAISGADSDQFTKSSDNCNGQTLGPGSNCTLAAAFAPTTSGGKTASLDASASPGGTASASLSGTGQTPANLTITPDSHDFGNVKDGTSSQTQSFTITNTGEQTSGTLSISVTGLDSADFDVSPGTSACGTTLAGGSFCEVVVTWNPPAGASGAASASLDVSASPGGSDSAALSGNAVATAANLQIGISSGPSSTPTYSSSASRDVGTLPGGAGSTVYVWIKNTGAADAQISNSPVPITRVNAKAELFASAFATCAVAGGLDATQITFSDLVVDGGSECYFPMRITMTTLGPGSVSFTITGSPGGSITATVTATGS